MSQDSKEKISLENYNYESKNNRLTSPLSIQACKLQGVTEDDLLYITFEEYIQSHPDCMNLPKEFQQERYDNYEQNRKDLIENLKEIRIKLKESINKEKAKTETVTVTEIYDENNFTQKNINNLNKDEYRKKLKNELEDNIKIQIEKEFEKEKKRKKSKSKINEESIDSYSYGLKQYTLKLNERRNNIKLKNEMNTTKRINTLDKKQKDYLKKEEKRKKHLEELRNEMNKKKNEEYEFKKNKLNLVLTHNEEKMKEKLLTFYKKKQEREERIEKREKEKLDELKSRYQEENKKKSERLKAAILRNEEIKNKKFEQYNQKLNNFIKNQKIKEDKEKEKYLKQKAINDLKESIINKRKKEMIQKENDEKEKYYKSQEKMEERLKLVKENKEKEKLIKLNKLYISENNLRIRHMREENAKGYLLSLKLQNIDKKRKLMKEKKEKEYEENAQKRKIKEEIIKDKQIMMERLKNIMQSGEEYTKEEVNDYVINGIKPKIKKNIKSLSTYNHKEKEIKENENKEKEIKENEDEYGGEEAFITELHDK